MTIGIVGLGLMGGSAAKALSARTGHTVYGFDKNDTVLDAAISAGAIKGRLGSDSLKSCDFIIIALYPSATIEYVEQNAANLSQNTVLVDFCGVKRRVFARLRQLSEKYGFTYIGGHPMAGIEKSGFDFSRESLFDGASMILTPVKEAGLEEAKALFLEMGFGNITVTDPEKHDRMIAYTSQLAHVLSGAYVRSPNSVFYKGFSANSFQDMTRVAYLNVDMWTELFYENGDYLSEEIEGLAARLLEYARAIRGHNEGDLRRILAEGRDIKFKIEDESL